MFWAAPKLLDVDAASMLLLSSGAVCGAVRTRTVSSPSAKFSEHESSTAAALRGCGTDDSKLLSVSTTHFDDGDAVFSDGLGAMGARSVVNDAIVRTVIESESRCGADLAFNGS
jgi:hypothetical protein